MEGQMDIVITKEKSGVAVKSYLLGELKISAAMLRHLKFLEDGILVNARHVTVRYILREGDVLSVKTEDFGAEEKITPSDIPLEVVFEDDDVVVPAKPPFMPTHPSHGHYGDTAANALCFRYKREGEPFVFRPVNRLDRNTSGLLLVARNRIAAARLFKFMKDGRINKEYLALLDGTLPHTEGEIETYMKRTEASIIVRRVCSADEGGDYALTKYKVVFSDGRHTLVLASPITGRTHQLRVHFAHMGAAIVGDDIYGKESEYIARHALHAFRLSFPHPATEETVVASSALPEDMKCLVRALFGEEGALAAREALSYICNGEDIL